ncbi:hypothetical protein ASPCAL08558 [Aspergillus calidoustus]|uniref:NmrA-like domain-containing protein n=1 Tax=Aspergillus calidoustus TaxID=454130 RepID=A0A0U5A143_ASPCI|nr:hypothetical protein ASPCAL08558 [Aspergillus calidoustus]
MKIALAGAGQVGLLLATEFCKSEDEVVVLTRTLKPSLEHLKVEIRLTDYYVDDLKSKLDDCDAGVKWTMICHGWFMEYVLPTEKNPLREIGLAWAMDHSTKVFDMYADGSQKVTLTSTADTARAVLAVLRNSINNDAELPPITLLAGQSLTYRELFQLIQSRDPAWTSRQVTFSEVLGDIYEGLKANDPSVAVHQLRILGFTNGNHNPEVKALKWGTGVLDGLRATTIEEFLNQAEAIDP